MTTTMEPRERLEHRAERAVARIPQLVLSIVIALAGNIGLGVWWAAIQTERQNQLAASWRETKDQINSLGVKVDLIRDGMPTTRDMEMISRAIQDHETRIRLLERAASPARGGLQP